MMHRNSLIAFLRHYGPIDPGDNMYDELIQKNIEQYGITRPIEIPPVHFNDLETMFSGTDPVSAILTGTAGDGKTYHCRRIWEHFGGDPGLWRQGEKMVDLILSESGRRLIIIKDLSELNAEDKTRLLPDLKESLLGESNKRVYLIAANDGQLLGTWRDFAEKNDPGIHKISKALEDMLVDGLTDHPHLTLRLFNLSRFDLAQFETLIAQIIDHPDWAGCQGCGLMQTEGRATCPIRLNRERLAEGTPFRQRLSDLLKLAAAGRIHLPIRDLLLLGVNILLGDAKPGQPLLTCNTARNRAKHVDYRDTNPYANVFGVNLPIRRRSQYQAFNTLESFGIGRETDNQFDNLLIYGKFNDATRYQELVAADETYGGPTYQGLLQDYLEGDREDKELKGFMSALERQRQRLFFCLPEGAGFNPWKLSVYHAAGQLLEFTDRLRQGKDVTPTLEILVRGLNRTFCGMMIDEGAKLYIASSGGDGRGRIASIFKSELLTAPHRRQHYVNVRLPDNQVTPKLEVIDPWKSDYPIGELDLQLTHFEYLIRVANGSLPASFSRQCYEDFLDLKLRLIEQIDADGQERTIQHDITIEMLTVNESGRTEINDIRILMGDR